MTRQRPFHEISRGRVKATVWHDSLNGVTRFHISFTRLFNDGERWWDGACFQRDDLPALGRLADDVHAWIWQQAYKLNRADGDGGVEGGS